jgi:hypothetical protein
MRGNLDGQSGSNRESGPSMIQPRNKVGNRKFPLSVSTLRVA